MEDHMLISFPAMQGEIGQRTYYSCMMKLNIIPKMFTFRDWAEFTPEDREQRILNKTRVPVIAKYMLDNEDGYLFSSIVASYKCETKFKPIGDDGLGMLSIEFEEANFVINDGQHRCAAIAQAIKENPALGNETISILLFHYESKDRVQQMFSDLNRFVAKTSKSLDILFDKRDPLSRLTLEVSELVPAFKGLVDKDAISLPVRSRHLFSLSSLYDANQDLLKSQVSEEEASYNHLVKTAYDYWTAVSAVMPDWSKVKEEKIKALELRQENISSHAVVLRAIGACARSSLSKTRITGRIGSKRLDPSIGVRRILTGITSVLSQTQSCPIGRRELQRRLTSSTSLVWLLLTVKSARSKRLRWRKQTPRR